jgi:hypothetical protein
MHAHTQCNPRLTAYTHDLKINKSAVLLNLKEQNRTENCTTNVYLLNSAACSHVHICFEFSECFEPMRHFVFLLLVHLCEGHIVSQGLSDLQVI